MGVVIKGGCGLHMWSPSNPPFQNPAYGPEKVFITVVNITLLQQLIFRFKIMVHLQVTNTFWNLVTAVPITDSS